MTQTIETIDFYSTNIKMVNKQFNKLMREISSPITNIPGISNRLGSVILFEINNVNNFKK